MLRMLIVQRRSESEVSRFCRSGGNVRQGANTGTVVLYEEVAEKYVRGYILEL